MARYNQSSDASASTTSSNVIYGYYIKKVNLRNLFYQAFYGTANANATAINIFIDINDIFKAVMYSNSMVMSNYEVSCALINMIAHYKSFLIDGGYGITPTFYLIWSGDNYGGQAIRRNPDYCINQRNVMFSNENFGKRQAFYNNISVVRTICQYLPEVYFIDGSEDSCVMIFNIIQNLQNNNPNIIITKDVSCNQITSYSNTLIFRPKKSKSSNNNYVDTSYIINSYTSIVSSLKSIPADGTITLINNYIPPLYWSLFFSINGNQHKSLQQIYDIRKTIKIIIENKNTIGARPWKGVLDQMVFPESNNANTNLMVMNRNFDCLDLYYRSTVYNQLPESKISLPAKLFDINGLKLINDSYFNSKGLFIDLITLTK